MAASALLPLALSGQVVINEILYHAPDELDDLQYIELHNAGSQPVNLSGWALKKGVQFEFREGARIDANGFLVLCRSTARFNQFYKVPVAGEFASHLKRKGERIELVDASGRVVDSVKFSDRAPWPTGPDGHSGSLERICPTSPGDDAANWISSPLTEDREKPGGTPGRVNAGYSAVKPPLIDQVKFSPALPTSKQSIAVEALVPTSEPVEKLEVLYRVGTPGAESKVTALPMSRVEGGRYAATIPAQKEGTLIRFQVRATGPKGSHREFPASTDPHPALSAYVPQPFTPAKVPFGWILRTTEKELKSAQQAANRPQFGGFFPPPPDPEEEDRDNARAALEQRLDLSPLWFEVGVRLAGSDAKLHVALREIMMRGLLARSELFNRFLDKGVSERLPTLGRVTDEFLAKQVSELGAPLSADQRAVLNAWVAAGPARARTGEKMIVSRADLEGLWQSITLNAEPNPDRLAGVVNALRALDAKRQVLLGEVAAGVGKETLFRSQRDRADDLGSSLVPTLRPLVSDSQRAQLDFWKDAPREVVVGFRGGPIAMFGGGGGRGPGGPGGFPGFRGPMGFPGMFGGGPTEPGTYQSAFVYFDPATGKTQLFDFVKVTGRKGGQKIHFQKDQPLGDMTTIALIFEGETESLVEFLAYEVYRRAGMPVEQSYPVRLWQDGKAAGYSILIEQPNKAFLRRNGIDDNGDMFKLLWFGGDLVGQHERHTHKRAGHTNLIAVVEGLERNKGEAQWEFIEKNFDVNEVATYFAVNTVLSHWDGFFNNYFTYQDTGGTGKWMMFPWDQDSTWGTRAMGGEGPGGVFTTMPITFGMNGDEPSGNGGWWRQPGFFSGPLLANPKFRQVFLARTKSILETVYNEKEFGPFLTSVEERMIPEVRARAEATGEDPNAAVEQLKDGIRRCREHLRRRGAFLLKQEEIRKLGTGK